MEAVLGQVEQLPALLAVSRSALVRDWDPLTLDRALEWARYFQHLHDRFRARPQLREALGRRLRRSQPYPPLGFPTLGRCPQLLGLALLENRALPPAACRRLLRSLLQPPGAGISPEPRGLLQPPGAGISPEPRGLLQPPGAGIGPEPRGLELLARRKAAACLLALPRRPPPRPAGPQARLQAEAEVHTELQRDARLEAEAEVQTELLADARLQAEAEVQTELQAEAELLADARLQAEAELLLIRLREERQEGAEAAGQRRWLGRALGQLSRPRALGVVAAALALLTRGVGTERAGDSDRDGSGPDGHPAGAAGEGSTAGLLLSWLLDNQERFSAFCLCLPCSRLAFLAGHYSQLSRSYLDLLTCWGSHLHYDPLQGRWVKSCLDKAEVSWEELKERFSCLCQGPALLKEQTQAALELLRTRDGDFRVRGLSVWTDILMEVGY